MPSLAMRPIAAAVSSVLFAASAAYAQQAPLPVDAKKKTDEVADTIVVTGIRLSVETSVNTKRNSDSIVEAISAEDIGKLPDVSIAESLARLPGLAGQRVGGRAQVIAIRGLSPDFAGTLLNGREQVTTGDNRSVEYDQFPSELINAATVYKTSDASLIGQGLSGTVDLKTIRPLDVSGRRVSLNARVESNSNGSVNDNTDSKGNRFSASYVDQFANRTVGVAVGFAHLDSPGQELHYKAWGYQDEANCLAHIADWGCSPLKGLPPGVTYLNGFEATAISRSQKRDGLMGVLEFKPNNNLHSTVDLYYSKFKKNETMRGLMGSMGDGWGGTPGATLSNVKTAPVGNSTTFVTAATFPGVENMVVRNDLNTREDVLKSVGWNTMFKVADGWSAVADLSYSSATRKENVIETYATAFDGTSKAKTTFNYVVNPDGGFPSMSPNVNFANVSTVKLTDPAGWGHDGLWKMPKVKDEIKAMRLEGKKDLSGAFSGLDFGANYTVRTKDREMNELAADLKNGRAPIAVPSNLLQPATSLGFAGIPGVLAYDVMGALTSLYDLKPQAVDQIINRNYEVSEKVTTAFAKLGIDTVVGGLPLTGNIGLQVIRTDQSSHGWSKLSGVFSEVTRGTTYNDVLPSLNLKLGLGDDRIVRFGLGKTLARARMDDMKAGADVNITKNTDGTTKWGGSGGNPELQPWRAKYIDLSFEQYIGKRSYVAFAGFYKELGTYIYTQQIIGNFSAFPNTSNPPLPTPQNPLGIFTRPANGEGGHVNGVELSTSLDASLVSAALEGFGMVASSSYTESSVSPDGPGSKAKLPGLSGVVSNLTLYYEKSGFSARVSQRYRSAFRGEINGLHNAREFTEILADKQIDMQTGYEFTSGSLKGLSVLLQVNNLTNSAYATKLGNGLGDAIAPAEYNKYGRQYLLGVNYKY
ncbi:MAG: TonB-dependent receptor [Betaproteobacteria bacterium]|nr:TonB-dependent receptor [Betaproteobacteria bacterium]